MDSEVRLRPASRSRHGLTDWDAASVTGAVRGGPDAGDVRPRPEPGPTPTTPTACASGWLPRHRAGPAKRRGLPFRRPHGGRSASQTAALRANAATLRHGGGSPVAPRASQPTAPRSPEPGAGPSASRDAGTGSPSVSRRCLYSSTVSSPPASLRSRISRADAPGGALAGARVSRVPSAETSHAMPATTRAMMISVHTMERIHPPALMCPFQYITVSSLPVAAPPGAPSL